MDDIVIKLYELRSNLECLYDMIEVETCGMGFDNEVYFCDLIEDLSDIIGDMEDKLVLMEWDKVL